MKNLMLVLAFVSSSIFAMAQSATNVISVGLGGYDAVAYFTVNDAYKGSEKFSTTHEGVTYYFASKKNKETFEGNPTKYLPEYGGYCATGVATANAKFPVDPETFKVTNGKLYLFYNGPYKGAHFNGKEPWEKEEKTLITKADQNWTDIKDK